MKNGSSGVLAKACFALLTFFFIGSSWPIVHAAATGYPEKAITLVVPMAAGGYTDLQARLLAEAMERELKQPVVVANKPGGAMTVGGFAVVSAKPDGYTLGLFPVGTSLPEAFTYFHTAPYTSADLRPVCRVATPVLVVAVRSDAPWNSFKELVEFARKNPRIKFAHTGKGGTGYSVMATIIRAEKLDLVDVPMDGDAVAVPALLGGHIPIATVAYPALKSLVAAKKVKVLALCIDRRAAFAPDVPPVVELGYRLPYIPFLALQAPKRTPDEVIKKLEETVRKVLEDKEFLKKNEELDSVLAYESAASFEKTLVQYKANLQTFFKEEGLVK